MKYREEKCPICSGDDFFAVRKRDNIVGMYCKKNAGSGLNGYLRKMVKIL